MKKIFRKYLFLFRYRFIIKNKIQKTVTEKIGKFKFTVLPSVFNPKDYLSSKIFADFVSGLDIKDKYILDMGTGSGIISVFASSKGAKSLAADISALSVQSSRENAAGNGFEESIEVIESSLFENISKDKKFDFIFFNPPYYKGEPANNFERAFKGGDNLETINNFLIQAKDYLKNDSKIYFIVSTDADLDLFWNLLRQNRYNYSVIKKTKKAFECFFIVEAAPSGNFNNIQ
jgi:release factor glutamine methyltransferase